MAPTDPSYEVSLAQTETSGPDPLVFSFEVFPPRSKAAQDRLLEGIRGLEGLSPRFVSVTYGAGGSTRRDTLATAVRIAAETGIAVAAHLTCVDASREEVDAEARTFWNAGIRHIVAIRGDPPGGGAVYAPHPEGYVDASDMVAGLKRIADFEISVAAYPEVHPEALSAEQDLDALKCKIDAGASRAITQFFFDTEAFLRFAARARAAGIFVPIAAGIMPVANFGRVRAFAHRCGVTIPAELVAAFEQMPQDRAACRQRAVSAAAEQCHKLRAQGQRDFHIYTMNDAPLAASICRALLDSDQ